MATSNGTGASARLNPAPVGTPAGDAVPGTPAYADTLLDIARELRAWGSVGLFGAADRLEALAQEVTGDAPADAPSDPPAPDAERLDLVARATWQIDALMGLIIKSASNNGDDVSLSLAIRTRELAGVIMEAAEDPLVDNVAELHYMVLGTHRASAGAAA